ncbi:MAG: ECF-type sigma factor, partial [Gemmatimonadota bacterium]|nr:ECF-type sigma factor [Gemmatimonadota bacterium]
MTAGEEITALLQRSRTGDHQAVDALFATLYDELHRLAHGQRHRWEGNYTLDTTGLVHEAYLKLVDQQRANFNDRSHFLAVATRAMRHILINYAERSRAAKRGGGADPLPPDNVIPMSAEVAEEVIAVHDAVARLEGVNERQARVVEARFFGGFTIEETAELLDISPATVKRDWILA